MSYTLSKVPYTLSKVSYTLSKLYDNEGHLKSNICKFNYHLLHPYCKKVFDDNLETIIRKASPKLSLFLVFALQELETWIYFKSCNWNDR